jgi:hypothetical protein
LHAYNAIVEGEKIENLGSFVKMIGGALLNFGVTLRDT